MTKPKTYEEVMERKVQIEKNRADAYIKLFNETVGNINNIVEHRVQSILQIRHDIMHVRRRNPLRTAYDHLCNFADECREFATFMEHAWESVFKWLGWL